MGQRNRHGLILAERHETTSLAIQAQHLTEAL